MGGDLLLPDSGPEAHYACIGGNETLSFQTFFLLPSEALLCSAWRDDGMRRFIDGRMLQMLISLSRNTANLPSSSRQLRKILIGRWTRWQFSFCILVATLSLSSDDGLALSSLLADQLLVIVSESSPLPLILLVLLRPLSEWNIEWRF